MTEGKKWKKGTPLFGADAQPSNTVADFMEDMTESKAERVAAIRFFCIGDTTLTPCSECCAKIAEIEGEA